MQVKISSQHLDLGSALPSYAENRINEIVSKYFDHAISSNIHFTKQGYLIICDLMVNEGTGRHMTIKSSAQCDDAYSSFDQSLAKLEKQLRRYKNKIKDHHKEKMSEVFLDASEYVIDRYKEEEAHIGDNPITIAESPVKIGTYSVSEAIMKMDLENLPALMFKNINSGRMNVVYHRKDGNIAWVDSR
jgi:ribosomal subunit interface protein